MLLFLFICKLLHAYVCKLQKPLMSEEFCKSTNKNYKLSMTKKQILRESEGAKSKKGGQTVIIHTVYSNIYLFRDFNIISKKQFPSSRLSGSLP